jgi:PAS domain S-box-containing protein
MSASSNETGFHSEASQQSAQLLASINGIVWEADARTFQFTFVSSQAERLLGYPLEQWLRPGFWADHIHPDDRAAAVECCQRALQEKRQHDFEVRMLAADGRTVWLRNIVTVVVEGNQPSRLCGIMVDRPERERTEEVLGESEELYRLLTENSSDLIYLLDREGRIVYASPSVGRLLGRVPASNFEVLHPEDAEAAQAYWERILGGSKELLTVRVRAASGTWHWLEARSSLISYRGQTHVLSVYRDITERQLAEDEARASAARFRILVDHATDAFFLHDADGTLLDVNRQACESLGYKREELIGLTPYDFDLDIDHSVLGQFTARLDAGEVIAFDTHHRRKDGTVFPVEVRIRPIWEGGRRFAVSLARDITERRRIEAAQRRNDAYLAEAQRLGRSGSWAWDVATREFVHWSLEHFRLHGLDPQQGTPSWETSQQFIHPDDRARCLELIERAVQERKDCELEYRAVHPDGTLRYIHSISHPVFNAAGDLVEFVGTEMDVTERKQAEAALRESEQRYREVFKYSSECIFLVDVTPEGRFQFVEFNPTEERMVGYTTSVVAGRFIEDVIPAELAAAVIPNYRRCVEAGTPLSYAEELTLPGGRKSFHTNLVPVRDGTGRIYRIIGVARDVSDQRRAEEALRHSEETLRRAQGIGHIGSWVFEMQEGLFIGSEEGNRICGWAPGPHSGEELLAIVHSDDRPRMQLAWQATLLGAPYEIEHRLIVAGQVRWVYVRAEPEVDTQGQVVRITGVTQDVTERKRGEEALRASLREKEVLLKEVHHRVKNNLQLINSLLALQAGQVKDGLAAAAFVESQNRVRAMALVHENLYRSEDLASVRLAGHLESLCAHLVRSYYVDPERIVLDLRVAEVTLDLDRSLRLGLLVNELVSNVLKHAFPAERSGRVLVQLDMLRPGSYLLVVSDNGVGLPADLAPGQSESLGLQLIADLTEQLGGTLALDRAGGTTFSIGFPAPNQEGSRS